MPLIYLKNPLPYLQHSHVDLRRGREHAPYILQHRNGISIGVTSHANWYVFSEVFFKELYTGSGQKLLSGDTVIDIGANIGCFSLLAAQKVGPSGRVFAIEPDPETYKQLVANIKRNNAVNITPCRLAIGETNGEATIFRHVNSLYSSLHSEVDGRAITGEQAVTATQTLERFMDDNGIRKCDYLKLDCEGSEYAIVRSLSASSARRIEQITMEVHAIRSESTTELDARIQNFGFSLNDSGELPYYFRPHQSPG